VVHYARKKREAGESKYPLRKMLSLAWTGITSFSTVPLRAIMYLGAVIFMASVAMAVYALWGVMAGRGVAGWASIVIPLYLLGGLLMLSIGVVGEYLARVFLETKRRPRYLIDEAFGAGEHDDTTR
jgi:predicted membrane metal-binding protein